jgi:hypothetical protein
MIIGGGGVISKYRMFVERCSKPPGVGALWLNSLAVKVGSGLHCLQNFCVQTDLGAQNFISVIDPGDYCLCKDPQFGKHS